jgi:hypothetical protein
MGLQKIQLSNQNPKLKPSKSSKSKKNAELLNRLIECDSDDSDIAEELDELIRLANMESDENSYSDNDSMGHLNDILRQLEINSAASDSSFPDFSDNEDGDDYEYSSSSSGSGTIVNESKNTRGLYQGNNDYETKNTNDDVSTMLHETIISGSLFKDVNGSVPYYFLLTKDCMHEENFVNIIFENGNNIIEAPYFLTMDHFRDNQKLENAYEVFSEEDKFKEISYFDDAHFICQVTICDDSIVQYDNCEIRCSKLRVDKIDVINEMDMWKDKEICLKMIEEIPKMIRYMQYFDSEFYFDFVKKNVFQARHIPPDKVTYEMAKFIVGRYGYFLKNVNKELQTEELCLIAVKASSTAIQFCKKQTEDICFLAVSSNGLMLEYVDEEFKTNKVIKAALFSSKSSIKFVPHDKQTEEMCRQVIEDSPYLIAFCKHKPSDICKKLVAEKPYMIKYFEDPKISVLLTADKNSGGILTLNEKVLENHDIMFHLCMINPEYANVTKNEKVIDFYTNFTHAIHSGKIYDIMNRNNVR